jgi:hypothetical protein
MAGCGRCGACYGAIISSKFGEGTNGKISGNKKRRKKEIAKNTQRKTAREEGQEGIKEIIAADSGHYRIL